MCGIWGYAGPHEPDLALVEAVAMGAARRGPHAWGWTNGSDLIRGLGALEPKRLRADWPADIRLLGHCRLATIGGQYDDQEAIQPLLAGDHMLAHNGNAYNWADLDPHAVSDSDALATTYARHRDTGATPRQALQLTVANARHNAWAIAVLDGDGSLVATRYRLPLFTLTTYTGAVYLSSVRFHPDAVPLAENTYLVAGAA